MVLLSNASEVMRMKEVDREITAFYGEEKEITKESRQVRHGTKLTRHVKVKWWTKGRERQWDAGIMKVK